MKSSGRRRSESGGWRLSRIEEEAEKLSLSSNNSTLDNDNNSSPRPNHYNSLDRSAMRSERFKNQLTVKHGQDQVTVAKGAKPTGNDNNNQDLVNETISKFFREKYDSIGPNKLETIYKPPIAGIHRSSEPQYPTAVNQSIQGQRKQVISALANQYEPEVTWRNFPPNCSSLLSNQQLEQLKQQQALSQQQQQQQHTYQKLQPAPNNQSAVENVGGKQSQSLQQPYRQNYSAHSPNPSHYNPEHDNQAINSRSAQSSLIRQQQQQRVSENRAVDDNRHPRGGGVEFVQSYTPQFKPPVGAPVNVPVAGANPSSKQQLALQVQETKHRLDEAIQRERENHRHGQDGSAVEGLWSSGGGQHYENSCYDSLENFQRNSADESDKLRQILEAKMTRQLTLEYENNYRVPRPIDQQFEETDLQGSSASTRHQIRDISSFPYLDDEVFEINNGGYGDSLASRVQEDSEVHTKGTRDVSSASMSRKDSGRLEIGRHRDGNLAESNQRESSRRLSSENESRNEMTIQRDNGQRNSSQRDSSVRDSGQRDSSQRDSVSSTQSGTINSQEYENLNKECRRQMNQRTLQSGQVSCVSEMFETEELLSEDQLVQIEIFYQSRKSEVVVCRCTAQLFLGPPSPLHHGGSGKQNHLTPIACRPFDEWSLVKGGVPLLLLDLNEQSLALILAEKGSAFPLWRDQLDRSSTYTALTSTFHALRMSNNPSCVMGLNYQNQSSALTFLEDIKKYLAASSQTKNIKNSSKQAKTKKKMPTISKSDISHPCCFTHVTKLGKKLDE